MDCTICEEKFSEYLEKRLDARQTSVLERHVTSCLDCSRKLDDWRYMMSVLEELEPVDLPDDAALTLDQAISWEISMNKPRKWFQVPAYQWAATSITAIAAIVLLVVSIPSLRQMRDDSQVVKKDTTLSAPELKEELNQDASAPTSVPPPQLPPVITTSRNYGEIAIREKISFSESAKRGAPLARSAGEDTFALKNAIKNLGQKRIQSIAGQINKEFPVARIIEIENAKFRGIPALIYIYRLHQQKVIRVTDHKGLILYSASAPID